MTSINVKSNQCPILLVEDNPDDVMLLKMALQKAGIHEDLRIARDGVEAIEYLSNLEDSSHSGLDYLTMIILLDLKLPKKSGLEVLKWIKSQQHIQKFPVIILTSSNQTSDINEAYKNHANSYVVKPVAFSDLVSIAEKIKNYWFEACTLPNVLVSSQKNINC